MSVVHTETRDGVCTVTLADVDNRNALSARLVAELTDALDEAEADDSVRVIVLTNEGRVFCAGADLSERSGAATSKESGGEQVEGSETPDGPGETADGPGRGVPVVELFARFGRSPKPYVGRIAGHCVAGGMGLAAAMDISVALDTAKMGFTEVRIGVAPAMISVLCLPRMRACDARSAFLRGRRFSASEAAGMGLVDAAVPSGELDSAVDDVVRDLLAGSPAGLAACKRLLARVPEMGAAEAFAWTAELSAELFGGEDAREGMAAYLQKRQPSWVPTRDD